MERTGQSTIQVPQPKSSLEDTFKAFIQSNSQTIQKLKNVTMVDSPAIQEIEDATMANTSATQRLEGQLNRLVAELNKREEEDLESQLMAERHNMINEDESNNSCHEHVPAITILESEKIVDNNEEEKKEEQVEPMEKVDPPSSPKLSHDKEVSTEAHSFITISLETFHEPQASVLQCLQESSYAKTVKDPCT
jgi:hypothetical protein